MEPLKIAIRRFFDFWICLFAFPMHTIKALFYYQTGKTSIGGLVFLLLMSQEISAEGDVLEIGSFKGGSSIALAAGNSSSRKRGTVWLVEPAPKPSKEVFLKNFKRRRLDKEIRLIDTTSEEARKIIDTKLRLIFIDGDHRYEFVKKDILLWKDLLQQGGVIAFHDYYWPGVARAIDEFVTESNGFTARGKAGDIYYALKGDFQDSHVLLRIQKLHALRSRLKGVATALGLDVRFSGREHEG